MLYYGGRWEVGVWWEVVDGGGVYGNFDMILDHFPRRFQLCNALHAPCAVVYVVPMLTVC